MKTYDEITENVLEGAKIYRQKVKRTQYAVSVIAMCTACALGLTLYSNLEKVDRSQPEQPTDSYTEFSSNLPTMNASYDPENGDILSSEPPPETNQPEISPLLPTTTATIIATTPAPSTDPTEAINTAPPETIYHETAPLETTAVTPATTAPPPETALIHTTTAVMTTTQTVKSTTTAPPPETTIPPATEPLPTEPLTEPLPETTECFEETEPSTEPEPTEETTALPIEEPDPEPEPTEEPTTEETTEETTTEPEPTTDPTEIDIAELETFKQSHPELDLTEEEWEVMFLLYGDSDLPFAFWYEMFGDIS